MSFAKGDFMSLVVTEKEVAEKLEEFLQLSAKEDVFITRRGRVIAVLTKPDKGGAEIMASLKDAMPRAANNGEI